VSRDKSCDSVEDLDNSPREAAASKKIESFKVERKDAELTPAPKHKQSSFEKLEREEVQNDFDPLGKVKVNTYKEENNTKQNLMTYLSGGLNIIKEKK